MQLALTNVINISVSTAQTGIGEYNVNNLALFTNDVPANSFGTNGYQIYLDPLQVATDFGTASETYAMANSVFSQQPNILAGGGYLAVIPYLPATESVTFDRTPTSGSFGLVYSGGTAIFAFNSPASTVQGSLRATFAALSQVTVSGSINVVGGLQFSFYGFYGTPAAFTISPNSLMLSGSATAVTATITQSGETLAAAITRTAGLVQYFGIMDTNSMEQHGSADVLAAAAAIQPLNKIGFFVSGSSANLGSNGIINAVTQADFTQTRCLYFGDPSVSDQLGMMSAYAGRALSTNFDGSNTTETMHLKDLVGVDPDPTMTQTLLNQAQAVGADCYVSLQGVAKVFTSGENSFFDQVYNLQWFIGALQVSGFNYLAESSTKIPQTEQGMNGLKGAYRAVCQQAVTNQYLAPGQWNSSTTFGNQIDFLSNITDQGYYIYSQPVSQQSQAARAAGQAPLVQIAVKQAGAIQESSVIVYVNA